MFELVAPHGARLQVPSVPSEDPVIYPSFDDDLAVARRYYDENGYVVVRNAIEPAVCDEMRAIFEREVKPFDGFIYRQATAQPERHVYTPHGFMLNSILNVHAVDPRRFPTFRRRGADLITGERLQRLARAILGEPGKLVQSMYFEGNPATWAHQDTYYLDSEQLGRMAAAWIALEDIAPGAGRFYVYPKSHLLELPVNRGSLSIANNHGAYKDLVLAAIRDHNLECRAPALNKGDVLLWSARTIHGSMETKQPERSRSSMTAHYIPASTRFMQFQKRIKGLTLSRRNGMEVHTPKDLAKRANRAILELETRFPKAYAAVKRTAVRLVTR